MINPPETLVDLKMEDLDVSNLERLGAYFTSQIHDLNNQMAVLSNASLLLEISGLPVSAELSTFLDRFFTSIDRLSGMCNRFNEARKVFPVQVEKVSLEEAAAVIFGTVGDQRGWSATGTIPTSGTVYFNPMWASIIVSQLIGQMQVEGGRVDVSAGRIPVRHYQYSLNSHGGEDGVSLLVHFQGNAKSQASGRDQSSGIGEFQIAMEFVRLMGAALSMGRSDNPNDYLLAFRPS